MDIAFCLPSECADRVRANQADIGILPVIEVARQRLDWLPGAGIACHGAVRSILLVSKAPPEKIRTLAADSGSRTSVVLSRIILKSMYGAEPQVVPMAPQVDRMLAAADAALLIGDAALRADPEHSPHLWLDLGAEWMALTGLPMVFAVWAGRSEHASPAAERAFRDSCRFGVEHIEDIIARESRSRGLDAGLVRRYLTRHIIFELGARDYEGMRTFLSMAEELDLVAA